MGEKVLDRVRAIWKLAQVAIKEVEKLLDDGHKLLQEGQIDKAKNSLRKAVHRGSAYKGEIAKLESKSTFARGKKAKGEIKARIAALEKETKKANHDLHYLYRVSRFSLARRYLEKFSTLPLLPHRLEEIRNAYDEFQARITVVQKIVHKAATIEIKIKEELEISNDIHETLSRFMSLWEEERTDRLLFTAAKKIFDLVEAVPTIKESMVDLLRLTGEFAPRRGNSWDEQMKRLEDVYYNNDREFGGFTFNDITFHGFISDLGLVNSTFVNCRFVNIQTYGIRISEFTGSKLTGCVFDNCQLYSFGKQGGFWDTTIKNSEFKNCSLDYRSNKPTFKRSDWESHRENSKIHKMDLNFSTFTSFENVKFSGWKGNNVYLGMGDVCTLKNVIFNGCPKYMLFGDDCKLENVQFLSKGNKTTIRFGKKIQALDIQMESCGYIHFEPDYDLTNITFTKCGSFYFDKGAMNTVLFDRCGPKFEYRMQYYSGGLWESEGQKTQVRNVTFVGNITKTVKNKYLFYNAELYNVKFEAIEMGWFLLDRTEAKEGLVLNQCSIDLMTLRRLSTTKPKTLHPAHITECLIEKMQLKDYQLKGFFIEQTIIHTLARLSGADLFGYRARQKGKVDFYDCIIDNTTIENIWGPLEFKLTSFSGVKFLEGDLDDVHFEHCRFTASTEFKMKVKNVKVENFPNCAPQQFLEKLKQRETVGAGR